MRSPAVQALDRTQPSSLRRNLRNSWWRWFGELTDKAIRRGVFHRVHDLIAAIETYLANYNQDATPFT